MKDKLPEKRFEGLSGESHPPDRKLWESVMANLEATEKKPLTLSEELELEKNILEGERILLQAAKEPTCIYNIPGDEGGLSSFQRYEIRQLERIIKRREQRIAAFEEKLNGA